MKRNKLIIPFLAVAVSLIAITLFATTEKGASSGQNNTAFQLKEVGTLPKILSETSGLALIGQTLISHNDKGKSNELYVVDVNNPQKARALVVKNAQNTDWEDLAQSDDYVYISDMGNNKGTRKDLEIIPIKRAQFANENASSLMAESPIKFNYPEQTDFEKSKEHNFDCEALIFFKNQFILFTKNRKDDNSNVYAVPNSAGSHAAMLLGSINTGARVTGAAMSSDNSKIALIGYNKKSDCYLWIISNFDGKNVNKAKVEKYTLGTFALLGQMEGIVFSDDKTLYISSEQTETVPAKLYKLMLN